MNENNSFKNENECSWWNDAGETPAVEPTPAPQPAVPAEPVIEDPNFMPVPERIFTEPTAPAVDPFFVEPPVPEADPLVNDPPRPFSAPENRENPFASHEAELPADEASKPLSASEDSEYHFVRPEAERSPYADAGYVPSADAAAVPRSYHTAVSEKKPKRAKRTRRGLGAAVVIPLCLVCAILGGLATGYLPGLLKKDAAPAEAQAGETTVINKVAATGTTQVATNLIQSGSEMSATDIYYHLAINQVVGVTTEITYTNFFGYTTSGAVSGSGFLISPDGYILTNHHVIEDAVSGGYEVKVLTYDGTEYVANVVGYEEDNDVAVLKIDGTDFAAATIGDSDAMKVGEVVYAVGNPLGELEYTMTDGMVSALDREISSKDSTTGTVNTINMFQISAAINNGNSGGPVYNSRGEVIGIASAKYADTGIEGLGFAIPINDAVKIAQDLITDGYVRGKAYMGISVGDVSASAAQYYGLVQGAIVADVTEGGCGEKAGLQKNDIIVAMDDTAITSRDELISAKKGYRAGDSAKLRVYRGGSYVELTITFDEETPELLTAEAEKEQQEEQQKQQQQQRQQGGYGSYYDFFNNFFGGYPFG